VISQPALAQWPGVDFWDDDPRDRDAATATRRGRRLHTRRRRRIVGALAAITLVVGGAIAATASGVFASAASAQQLDLSDIEDRVDPAVVDITAELPNGEAAGTGMVITSDGEILTNNHVVEGAIEIRVTIGDDDEDHRASVIGTAPFDDVALLKVRGVSDLPTVDIGDVSELAIGDAVIAIGNAFGADGPPRATEGDITDLDQAITVGDGQGNSERLDDLIQISAELAPGNSGGPLVNSAGEVIGINTAAEINGRRLRRGDQSSDVGFAIPIDGAMAIVEQIEDGDETETVRVGPTGYLGVQVRNSDGALVLEVVPDGPADEAGIAAGDTLTGIDDDSVLSSNALGDSIRAHEPGDEVTITWLDEAGEQHEAQVRLAENPAA